MKNIILPLLIVIAWMSPETFGAYKWVDIGDTYPSFCALRVNGEQYCPDRNADRVQVFSFFRVGQPESQEVLRILQEMSTQYGDRISVVGILSGEVERREIVDFLQKYELVFPIVLDVERQLYGEFGVFLHPATGFFDSDGILRFYLPGKRLNFRKYADGYLQFLLGDISEAELDAILHPPVDDTDPRIKRAENSYNLARIYVKRGKLSKAKEALDGFLREYADYAPLHALYGSIYLQEEFYEQACEKFETALQLDAQLKEAVTGRQACGEMIGVTD